MQYVIPDWIQDGEKLLQRITENSTISMVNFPSLDNHYS